MGGRRADLADGRNTHTNHVHYALRIGDGDFDGAVARLREHGYDPEIVSFDDDDRGRSFYVIDPDGNVVECWTWDVKGHLAS